VTVVRREAGRRWLTVAAAVVVLAALPAAVNALPVRAPGIDLAGLAARIRASAVQPFQGYAVSTGTAGLPALPRLSDVTDLLNGETRLRVWYAGPRRWRVDVLDLGAERDTYQLPDAQLVWDYGANQLTRIVGEAPVRLPRGADLTPPDLGRRLLAAADRTTPAGPGTDADGLAPLPARRIAGIDAAGMRITPRNPVTTVGHIDVWADPATGLPLEVAVTGRKARQPFLVTRFLEVSLSAPVPAVLTPPAARPGIGYTVTDAADVDTALRTLGTGPLPDELAGQERADLGPAPLGGVGGYGSGLAQFLVLPLPRRTGFDLIRRVTRGGGTPLTYPDGDGVVISTPLISLLALDAHPARRTYLLVGLVDGALLKQAGADLASFRGGI